MSPVSFRLGDLGVSPEAEAGRRVGGRRRESCGNRSCMVISFLQVSVGVEGGAELWRLKNPAFRWLSFCERRSILDLSPALEVPWQMCYWEGLIHDFNLNDQIWCPVEGQPGPSRDGGPDHSGQDRSWLSVGTPPDPSTCSTCCRFVSVSLYNPLETRGQMDVWKRHEGGLGKAKHFFFG